MPKKRSSRDLQEPTEKLVLTADELSEWTGLTDKRHRQIADEGYFPPPDDGLYILGETIKGMFRYYRDQAGKAKGKVTELRQVNLERQNRRLEIEIKKIEGEMIEVREVREMFMRVALLLKSILFGALEQELPAKASGKTPEEIRMIARGIGDRMLDCLRNEQGTWETKH